MKQIISESKENTKKNLMALNKKMQNVSPQHNEEWESINKIPQFKIQEFKIQEF